MLLRCNDMPYSRDKPQSIVVDLSLADPTVGKLELYFDQAHSNRSTLAQAASRTPRSAGRVSRKHCSVCVEGN